MNSKPKPKPKPRPKAKPAPAVRKLRVRDGEPMPSIGLRATDGYLMNLRSHVTLRPSIVAFVDGRQGEELLLTLRDAYPRLQATGVGVLPVSTASETAQRAEAEKLQLPFPLLSDERRSAVVTLGIPANQAVAFAVGLDGTILDAVVQPELRGLIARLLEALLPPSPIVPSAPPAPAAPA